MVRDEGPYPAHLRAELLYELQVHRKVVRGLVGGSHHEADTDGVTDVPEVLKAAHAALEGHLGGMQAPVVQRVGGLVAQQVALGARVMQGLVARAAALPHRQRHGAVGMGGADARDDVAEALVGKPRVLAALQDEGAKAEPVAFLHAREDALRG